MAKEYILELEFFSHDLESVLEIAKYAKKMEGKNPFCALIKSVLTVEYQREHPELLEVKNGK